MADTKANEVLNNLVARHPALTDAAGAIERAYQIVLACYRRGGKALLCGNGGSCADAEHIAGELVKGFMKKRPIEGELRQRLAALGEEGARLADSLQMGLAAIPLNMQALSTAVINDLGGDLAFAQQVAALGRPGDVLIGITTSGNARNVRNAALVARSLDMSVVGLTGAGGGLLAPLCDALIAVPERETYKVQELHLPAYHALCAMLEAAFFEQ
ncbi:MAG: SIS domain-containing protein [Clostridiales bacterium]|nr:SIS domain-containing protein [Clostridiales bacterium]